MTEHDPRPMSVIREETIAASIARKSQAYREGMAEARRATAAPAPPTIAPDAPPAGVPLPPMDAYGPDDVALTRHRVAMSIGAKQQMMPPTGPNGSITPHTQLGAEELAAHAEAALRRSPHSPLNPIVDPYGYEPPQTPDGAE